MQKNLFDKLVLSCEDEILNTTKTSNVDTKVTYKHTTSLVIICLPLLIFTSFSF